MWVALSVVLSVGLWCLGALQVSRVLLLLDVMHPGPDGHVAVRPWVWLGALLLVLAPLVALLGGLWIVLRACRLAAGDARRGPRWGP